MNEQTLINKCKIKEALERLEVLENTDTQIKQLYFEGHVNGYKQCLMDLGILEPEKKEIPEENYLLKKC